MRLPRLLLPVVVVASSSSALGAVISYDDTFGPTAVPAASTPVMSLPLFNPVLGTLTKVTLTLDATTDSGTISWDNEALVESDITLGIGAEVTASAMSALTAVAIPLQTGDGHVDADNDGAADFLGTDAFSVTGGSGSESDSTSSTLAATLTAYTGVGTFPVSVGSGVETFLSTSGGFGPIDPIPGQTFGTVTVAYEYIPVPAPSVLGVMALCGIGVARRRR